jgi:hypothetical protein
VSERHADPLAGYRWVDPPADAPEADRPLDRQASVPADDTQLHATEVWTGDLQAVLALDAVPLSRRARTEVDVDITAVAPATLGELPPDAFADGNAYEVVLRDGDDAIDQIEPAGRIILRVPHAATDVLHSADGQRWRAVESTEISAEEIEARLAAPGFYLAVADHPLGGTSGDGLSAVGTAAALGAPLLLLALVLLLTRRWRANR